MNIQHTIKAGIRRLFASRVDPNWLSARVVFGLSTGRCGTSSLSRLVSLLPEIESVHEIDPRPRNPLRVAPYYSLESQWQIHGIAFQERRAQRISRAARQGKVYVELNGMKFHAPVIAELMPGSRFFFVHRHPAEFVRSGMRRGWYESHPADVARLVPQESDPARSLWSTWSRLERIAWLWSATNEYFLKFLDSFESTATQRIARFRFDSLMDHETGEYLRLFELIGVTPPPDSEVAKILSTPFNAQQTGSFPEPASWEREDCEALLKIAGSTMEKLGYEVDELRVPAGNSHRQDESSP